MLDLEFGTFLAVVRHHTFSRAAEHLHVTQSTVSYRLRTLEGRLGLILLDRGRGRQAVRLTVDGEELLKLAELWEALHVDIQQLSRRGAVLAIGAPDSVNTYILSQVYAEMAAHHPDLQLKVVTANSRELYDLLDAHELDVAFPQYQRASPALRVQVFCREQMMVVSRSELPSRGGAIDISELDLADELQLGWPDPVSGSRTSNRAFSRIHVDTTHLVLPFLANRRKWVVIPASMAAALAESGTWHVYPLSDPKDGRTIFEAVRRQLPRAARRNYALLQQYLEPVRVQLEVAGDTAQAI
jgi:DNA-binding transcriptional LysR family regulator